MSSNEEKKTTLPKKSLSTVKPKPVAITKKPVAITKQELISKIPKSIRKQERRLRLGIGLPRINESQSTTVERINPMQILLKKTRTKTHPPKFTSKSTDFTEVIGEEAVKKAKKAINSGVPIAQPRWVKNKKKEKELRNFSPFAAYQVAPGRSRNRTKRSRGGKRKRHKTRKRKRKRKRRKHFKGGFFEKPGAGIKAGQTVRIKTKNSTDDTKTWDPCWKVMVMMNRAAIVEKNMEERTVRFTDIKPQGEVSKFRLKCGGKRRKTHRRKKHKRRKTRKRKRRRRGGVADGFLGEESCGEVRQHQMFDDCCGLDKAEIEAEKNEIELIKNRCIERLRALQQENRERQRRYHSRNPE